MKRRVFGFLLALAMVISLLPPIQLEAKAETVEKTPAQLGAEIVDYANKELTFPEEGGNVKAYCPACEKEVTWIEAATTGSMMIFGTTAGGHYYLNKDISNTAQPTTSPIYVNSDTCIHLNGHNVTTETKAPITVVAKDGVAPTLNIMGNGNLSGITDVENGYGSSAIHVSDGAIVNIYGGTFTRSDDAHGNSPLIMMGAKNAGTINMYGGRIDGLKQEKTGIPGCIYIANANGAFNLYDGTITNGYTTGLGGNIRIKVGSFAMYGGTVSGGKGSNGGNIYLDNGLATTISGGSISGGTATDVGSTSMSDEYHGGGNIFVGYGTETVDDKEVKHGSTLTITNTTISSGTSESNGGNILIHDGCQLILGQGAIVYGGNAKRKSGGSYNAGGGNVYIYNNVSGLNNSKLTMLAGSHVYGGTTGYQGANVSIVNNATFDFQGGTIGQQSETGVQSSLYLQRGSSAALLMTMSGGVLYGQLWSVRGSVNIQDGTIISTHATPFNNANATLGVIEFHHGTFSFNPTAVKGYKAVTGTAIVDNDGTYYVHKPTNVLASEATCTASGKIAHVGCSVCKKAFEDATCAVEIDATDATKPAHTQTAVEATPATCTTAGNKAYYACQCGLFYEDEACTKNIADLDAWKAGDGALPVAEHTYVYGYKNATAHTVDCSECDTVFADGSHNTRTGACEFCGAKEIMGAVAAVRNTQYFVNTEENQWFTLGMWGGRETGSNLTFNETVVLKIYSGDELVITTSLKEDGKYGTDGAYVVLKGSQANWTTETATLTEDNVPTSIEVYLDGIEDPISTYTKKDGYKGSIFNQDQYNAYLAFSAVHKHSWDNDCDTQCNGCDKTREPADHNWIAKDAAEATCSAKGNIAYFQCDECDAYAVKDGESYVIKTWAEIETPIAEDNHAYPETWTDAGENHKKVCGNDATHVITEAHSFVYANTGVGTCVCGATTDCEHTYTYTPNNDATCEADGTKHGVCSNCGNEVDVDDEGSKLSHTKGNPVQENIQQPTCTEEGSYDLVYYCSVCGEVESKEEGKVIPAKEHKYAVSGVYNETQHQLVCGNDETHITWEVHDGNDTCVCGYVAKTYVAQIGEQKFESLAEAVAAVTESAEIKLLDDITLTETVFVRAGITLNLNGYTIFGSFDSQYGMIYVSANGGLWVKNGTIENNGGFVIGNYGFAKIESDATVLSDEDNAALYNFYYNASTYGMATVEGKANIIWNCGDLLIAEGAEVEYLDNSGMAEILGQVDEIYGQDGSDCPEFEGAGTLTIADPSNIIIDEDYKLVEVAEGVYKVTAKVYVVENNDGIKFESFEEALLSDGACRLILLADIVLTEKVTVSGEFTLELNGFSITGDIADEYGMFYVRKDAGLYVYGEGSIVNTGSLAIGNYGNVRINNGVTVEGADAGLYNFYYGADYYGRASIAGKVNVIWNCGTISIQEGAEVEYLDNSGYAEDYKSLVTEIYAQDGSDCPELNKAGIVATKDTSNITLPEGYELELVDEAAYRVIKHVCAFEELVSYTEPTAYADGYWTYKCACGETNVVVDEGTRLHVDVPVTDEIQNNITTEEGVEVPDEDVIGEIIENVITGNAAVTDTEIFSDEANNAVIEEMKQEKPELADAEPVLKVELTGMGIKSEDNGYRAHRLVFDVTPMLGGTKIELAAPITFRLPIDDTTTATEAYVYHDGVFMGKYAVQEENGHKFVEVTSAEFSEYIVETDHVHVEKTVTGYGETCTEPGLTDGVICEDCGETLTAQQPIAEKGHDYSYTSNGDGTHTGVCANNCGIADNGACDESGAEGACSKCGYRAVYVASFGGEKYENLADALKAAARAGGGIVKLESDITVDEISVRNNVTLDLNGKKLTVEGYVLAAFENSSIVDNSDDNSGRLVADLEMIRLLDTNAQLPVQMDDGIMFVYAALTQKWYDDEGDYGFWLDVAETDEALVDALKNGSASSCNLKFRVDVKWTQNSLKYTFDDATVDAYAQNWIGLAFYLHVNGAEKVSGLTYQAKVIFAEGTLAQVVYTVNVPMDHPEVKNKHTDEDCPVCKQQAVLNPQEHFKPVNYVNVEKRNQELIVEELKWNGEHYDFSNSTYIKTDGNPDIFLDYEGERYYWCGGGGPALTYRLTDSYVEFVTLNDEFNAKYVLQHDGTLRLISQSETIMSTAILYEGNLEDLIAGMN